MVYPVGLIYIVVLMLSALDFWITKNIIGRKLVKLRWWYIIDEHSEGSERWIFESKSKQGKNSNSIRESSSDISR